MLCVSFGPHGRRTNSRKSSSRNDDDDGTALSTFFVHHYHRGRAAFRCTVRNEYNEINYFNRYWYTMNVQNMCVIPLFLETLGILQQRVSGVVVAWGADKGGAFSFLRLWQLPMWCDTARRRDTVALSGR